MPKWRACIDKAMEKSGLTVDQVDFVEIIGGACRTPWVKRICQEAFDGKELSSTLNADEYKVKPTIKCGIIGEAMILPKVFFFRSAKMNLNNP